MTGVHPVSSVVTDSLRFQTGLACITVLVLITSGCTLWSHETTVELLLPATPTHWIQAWGEPAHLVVLAYGRGAADSYVVPAGQYRVTATIPKEQVVAITATPVWEDGPATVAGETLRPAGAVWPYSATPYGTNSHLQVELTYQAGFFAGVVAGVIRAGGDARSFNISRFGAEVTRRISSDPWLADAERMVQAICERRMRVDYIAPERLHLCEMTLPGGIWHHCSPFREPVSGGEVMLQLPAGLTMLYDATGGRVVIDVDGDGRVWLTAYR